LVEVFIVSEVKRTGGRILRSARGDFAENNSGAGGDQHPVDGNPGTLNVILGTSYPDVGLFQAQFLLAISSQQTVRTQTFQFESRFQGVFYESEIAYRCCRCGRR
jgi:hypothetical protein